MPVGGPSLSRLFDAGRGEPPPVNVCNSRTVPIEKTWRKSWFVSALQSSVERLLGTPLVEFCAPQYEIAGFLASRRVSGH